MCIYRSRSGELHKVNTIEDKDTKDTKATLTNNDKNTTEEQNDTDDETDEILHEAAIERGYCYIEHQDAGRTILNFMIVMHAS